MGIRMNTPGELEIWRPQHLSLNLKKAVVTADGIELTDLSL